MRDINRIIVHCSVSEWGNAAEIDRWHRERKFRCIGYHFVIGNCYPTSESYRKKKPDPDSDGKVEAGRPLEEQGAHTKGYNKDSIGICLIGERNFTSAQLWALKLKVLELVNQYPSIESYAWRNHNKSVTGHYEWHKTKTCPNIDMTHMSDLIFHDRLTMPRIYDLQG